MGAKKYVLTGGPSSGKTSLLNELRSRGLYFVEEAAKDVIESEQKKGNAEPWLSPDFQDKILDLQLEREAAIPQDLEVAILDRGIPDGLAYHRHRKAEPSKKLLESIAKCDYQRVFLLEQIPSHEKTSYRTEDAEEAKQISEKLKKTYNELGYKTTIIPAIRIKERADMIMKYIESKEKTKEVEQK